MDCLTVNREELTEKYLQEKLDPAQQDEFETHLLECPKCMQELELLQALRRDLADRAHEIRGWTASKPFFRWQVAVLAMAFVMALAFGIRQLRESKKGNDSAEIAQKKQKDELKPLVAEAPKSDVAEKPLDSVSAPSKAPTVRAAKKEAADATPLHAPSQAPVISDPSTPATPKREMPTQPLPGTEIPPAPIDSQTAARNVDPGANPASQVTPALTTAQGVELARIGMVEAPPYTFSGMVLHLIPPKDDKRGGFTKDKGSPGAGRVLFQKGMKEYVDGHYSEAAGYLEQAVKLEPAAADINFYLGICKLLQGHPDESISPLKNAGAAGQSIYLQPSHYYLAKAYVQGNKLADAEEELRKAIAVPGRLTSDAKGLLARLQILRQQIEKP
jgi:tetratricopeptide repeat protein